MYLASRPSREASGLQKGKKANMVAATTALNAVIFYLVSELAFFFCCFDVNGDRKAAADSGKQRK
jgi:hypothetical protein